MKTMAAGVALMGMAAAAAMGTVLAASAEDDLAVVKRAVAVAQVRPSGEAPPARMSEEPIERERPARTGREPQWLKVRITEKNAKKARVNVNLPIALVRAFGDDWPIDFGGRRGWRGREGRESTLRMGDVLATLEAGQALVEIDDEDATVRIWVE